MCKQLYLLLNGYWTIFYLILPSAGQSGSSLQLLRRHRPHLHLLPGHQEQGSGEPGGQEEEAKPLYSPPKCQEKRALPCEETAEVCTSDFQCPYCCWTQVWPMWIGGSFWKGAETAHKDETQGFATWKDEEVFHWIPSGHLSHQGPGEGGAHRPGWWWTSWCTLLFLCKCAMLSLLPWRVMWRHACHVKSMPFLPFLPM